MEFDLTTADGTLRWLKSVCARFDDVVDEADAPIPISEQLRGNILSVSFIRIALMRHYSLAMSKTRLGNRDGPGVLGQPASLAGKGDPVTRRQGRTPCSWPSSKARRSARSLAQRVPQVLCSG